MTPKFVWKCSYMGTLWFDVTDESGTYSAEFRQRLTDYESSIANGDDCRRDMHDSIGILHREGIAPGGDPARLFEVSQDTVSAFNAWRLAERADALAKMQAAPERYGDIAADDPFVFPPMIAARRGWYVMGQGWQSVPALETAGFVSDAYARPLDTLHKAQAWIGASGAHELARDVASAIAGLA